jgi:hypothetical protein
LEKYAASSELFDAATVIADAARAGELSQASAVSLPAATATVMPEATIRSIAESMMYAVTPAPVASYS